MAFGNLAEKLDTNENKFTDDDQARLNYLEKLQSDMKGPDGEEWDPIMMEEINRLRDKKKFGETGFAPLNEEEEMERLELSRKQTDGKGWTPKDAERSRQLNERYDKFRQKI